jgi:predicted permease
VLTFNLSPPPSLMNSNAETVRAFTRELNRRLAATPGVQAVSMTWAALPMAGDDEDVFWLDGQPKPASQNEMNWTVKYVVDPDYLKVMEIPLRRGRFFTPQDNEHAPSVAVIDEALAKRYFGNDDPIGKRLRLMESEGMHDGTTEIVGVVDHVNQWGLASDPQNLQAQIYLPTMQMPDSFTVLLSYGTSVVVRYAGAAPGIIDSIRDTSRKMNSEQVVFGEQTMQEIISDSISDRKFSMVLLGTFAAIALLLSSIGIYGVISYLIGQRTHEIGIRMALGAQRKDILSLVLGEGVRLVLLGAAIGIVAALGLTRLMTNLLYGVSAKDPLTFAAVPIVLLGVAMLACYLPARRAMRLDPNIALRHE